MFEIAHIAFASYMQKKPLHQLKTPLHLKDIENVFISLLDCLVYLF